jgi:hypothetical protein
VATDMFDGALFEDSQWRVSKGKAILQWADDGRARDSRGKTELYSYPWE